MPQLSDIAAKRKFIKKEYRPWDLTGSGTVDGKEKIPSSENSQKIEASSLEVTLPIKVKPDQYIDKAEVSNPTNLMPDSKKHNKSDNVTDNKRVTNKEQPENNRITQRNAPEIVQRTTREQQENVSDNVTGNIYDISYLVNTIKNLSGLQKSIFNFVITSCAERGALETGNVLILDLANAAQCTIGSAKTSLSRLIDKKVVIRHPGKASRGGHMVLGVTKEIQAATIQAQKILFNPASSLLTGNKTSNESGNISPFSSSNILKTTTNLDDEWNFNIEAFAKIGFTLLQLKQLANLGTLNPNEVEQSLIEFTFDFENGSLPKNIRTSNINFLMGLLRRGTPYVSESYRTEQERIDAEMAKRATERKKQIMEERFMAWESSLTVEDRKKIEQEVPPGLRSFYLTEGISSPLVREFMFKYFYKI